MGVRRIAGVSFPLTMAVAERYIEVPLLLPDDPAERRRRVAHFLRHVRAAPGVRLAEVIDVAEQPVLRIEADRRATPLASLERIGRHAGIEFRQRWAHLVLRIEGMASPQSEEAVEAALEGLPGVRASASFPSRTLRLEFDRTRCQLPEIAMRLGRLGFRIAPTTERPALSARERAAAAARSRLESAAERACVWVRAWRPLVAPAVAAVLLVTTFALEALGPLAQPGAPAAAALGLYLACYVIAGWETARDTMLALSRAKFNIDVLMFLAAIGAGALGHWAEGALLLTLFAFGHAGEELAMGRARRAIESLYDAAPETAELIEDGGAVRTVHVDELSIGDRVLVRPGERVPVDGSVGEGVSEIDQSAITGESMPVDKGVGSPVFAGTINGDGALTIAVEKLSSETTLAKAIRLVEEAQTQKSPTELFTARVERVYVPVILGATALLFVVMPLVEGGGVEHWRTWFYRSMAFLTAASPCALAIGTPAATLSALARAAKIGVLIKGGVHLETLGRLRAVAFDKTGTLTVGRPRVGEVAPVGDATELDVLSAAAAVEMGSAHPLAAAIVDAAREAGWTGPVATGVEQIVGMGLRGRIGADEVEVGSPRLFERDPGLAVIAAAVAERQREGSTVVLVRRAGRILGAIALSDRVRPDAERALAESRRLGVRRIVMLTGDNEQTAAAVATLLGVDEHHASLLPDEKMRVIGELRARYGVVAMVGDGVNDAPALAAASVGVAMGAAGADVALETADVALMHDDLSRFPETLRLAKFARRVITENLVIALGVIAVLAPLAATGHATIGWAVFFHEGSTVVVVLNALRLLRFRTAGASASPGDRLGDEVHARRAGMVATAQAGVTTPM